MYVRSKGKWLYLRIFIPIVNIKNKWPQYNTTFNKLSKFWIRNIKSDYRISKAHMTKPIANKYSFSNENRESALRSCKGKYFLLKTFQPDRNEVKAISRFSNQNKFWAWLDYFTIAWEKITFKWNNFIKVASLNHKTVLKIKRKSLKCQQNKCYIYIKLTNQSKKYKQILCECKWKSLLV